MFTTEFEAEVDESESATLQQYYREAMIQGYNFAFEVKWQWISINEQWSIFWSICDYLFMKMFATFFFQWDFSGSYDAGPLFHVQWYNDRKVLETWHNTVSHPALVLHFASNILFFINLINRDVPIPVLAMGTLLIHVKYKPIPWHRYQLYTCAYVNLCLFCHETWQSVTVTVTSCSLKKHTEDCCWNNRTSGG